MKWEYKVMFFSVHKWTFKGIPDDIGIEFNRLGDDDWELVRTEPLLKPSAFAGSFTSGIFAFFKRRKD